MVWDLVEDWRLPPDGWIPADAPGTIGSKPTRHDRSPVRSVDRFPRRDFFTTSAVPAVSSRRGYFTTRDPSAQGAPLLSAHHRPPICLRRRRSLGRPGFQPRIEGRAGIHLFIYFGRQWRWFLKQIHRCKMLSLLPNRPSANSPRLPQCQ